MRYILLLLFPLLLFGCDSGGSSSNALEGRWESEFSISGRGYDMEMNVDVSGGEVSGSGTVVFAGDTFVPNLSGTTSGSQFDITISFQQAGPWRYEGEVLDGRLRGTMDQGGGDVGQVVFTRK